MSHSIRISDVLKALDASPDPRGSADVARELLRPAPLASAGPDDLTFVTAEAGSNTATLRACNAGMAIVAASALEPIAAGELQPTIASSPNPRLDFIRILQRFFARAPASPAVDSTAVVAASARVADDVSIGALCTIGERVQIGAGSILYAGVHIYPDVRIGSGVVINSGTVIGADGYGFERDPEGKLQRFPHIAGVVIEDDVEIGANVCIDRGALVDTRIGRGVRIDDLVMIAHNAQIGADAAVIGGSTVSGSVVVGPGAWIAPNACVREGITVGARAVVGLGAIVTADVPDDTTVLGNPARELGRQRELQAALKRLADRSGGDLAGPAPDDR